MAVTQPELAGKLAHARLHARRLQGMAAGLVEDDAAEAARDDHGHLARRAVGRGQHRHGRGRRRLTSLLGVDALAEELKAHQRAGVLRAGLVFCAVAGDRRAGQAGIDARILRVEALAVGDEHMLLAGDQPRRHLGDRRGDGARRRVRRAQDVGAPLRGDREHALADRMDVLYGRGAEHDVLPRAARVGDGGRRLLRRAQQARFRHLAGVDIDGAQAVIDADARAARARKAGVLDLARAQQHREIPVVLGEDLRERAAAGERPAEHPLADGC